jgi:hypothetical protein
MARARQCGVSKARMLNCFLFGGFTKSVNVHSSCHADGPFDSTADLLPDVDGASEDAVFSSERSQQGCAFYAKQTPMFMDL